MYIYTQNYTHIYTSRGLGLHGVHPPLQLQPAHLAPVGAS